MRQTTTNGTYSNRERRRMKWDTEYQQGTQCFIRRSKSVSRVIKSETSVVASLYFDYHEIFHCIYYTVLKCSFRFLFYSSIRLFLTALFATPKTIPSASRSLTTPAPCQRITKLIYKPNEYTRLVGLIEMQMGTPYSGLWRTSYFIPPCPPPILFRRVFQGKANGVN